MPWKKEEPWLLSANSRWKNDAQEHSDTHAKETPSGLVCRCPVGVDKTKRKERGDYF